MLFIRLAGVSFKRIFVSVRFFQAAIKLHCMRSGQGAENLRLDRRGASHLPQAIITAAAANAPVPPAIILCNTDTAAAVLAMALKPVALLKRRAELILCPPAIVAATAVVAEIIAAAAKIKETHIILPLVFFHTCPV